MIGRYALVGTTHFLCTALALKILNFVLPCFLTCYYSCVANFLMCAIVAKLTFGFTKKKFLSEEIQPENKAVFITGCDSGFGNAFANRFDSLGFDVFAGCLNPSGPGAEELKKNCSKRLQVVPLDVTNDDSVKEAAKFVKDNLNTSELWAIVNNAGIQKGFIMELSSIQDFKDTMDVNAIGPVRVTKAFLPLLRQSRGRVVNIASLAGRVELPMCASYTMSKFACAGFSECIRHELDVWGIRVISIEPEFFETNLTNTNNISRKIDESFASVDEDVKADYGEQFIKTMKMHTQLIVSSSKIYKVINAVEKAICLEQPDFVYRPCRNIAARIFYKAYEISPKTLQLLTIKFLLYITSFPKPKEADNNL